MALGGDLMDTRFTYSTSSSSSSPASSHFATSNHAEEVHRPGGDDKAPEARGTDQSNVASTEARGTDQSNVGSTEGKGTDESNVDSTEAKGTDESNVASTAVTSLVYLPQTVVLCEPRHEAFDGCGISGSVDAGLASRWRPKERMRTGCVALVLCLNISVDPPDVIKISPCARMECWIDPFSMVASKALDAIGKTLHAQYERWQPRARYKLQLDPTVEEVKKLCINCRKNARLERVLFHYNGHGVPKPTVNGEIWVFNKSYTQYIPLPVSELDSWLKTPSIYVFDCSAAGMIVNAFIDLIDSGATTTITKDCILLAACQAHENLPQSAEFPADIFTSCLTTPIKMALRWFCSRSLLHDIDHNLIDQIPGRQNDRKTLLGELNWIFTAVTDTIAWNVLPHELFQKLFRQDLLVASLFRNFLLAERIMRSANCSPVSYPPLPSTHQHHMWDAWDMAAECCLAKLRPLLKDPNSEFQPSPFFSEQLTAFEVWLDHGSERKKPPEQLPIVLQVLLSQSHRFRALVLLGRFLDMGPWAVDLALSVGIFPYVLKLLQTTASELRNILVFIWTKILALDKSCQVDLVKDGGHIYFIKFLDSVEAYPEQRAMAAFVLAVIVDGHRRGQEACIQENMIHVCLSHLQLANTNDSQAEPLLFQWLCLCLGKLWEDFPEAQLIGLQADAPAICSSLLSEPQPEVRAAAVFALGTLIDVSSDILRDGLGGEEDIDFDEKTKLELSIVKNLLDAVIDGSPLVRAEVVVALARFTFGHNKYLKSVATSYWKPQAKSLLSSFPSFTITSSPSNQLTANQYIQTGSMKSSHVTPAIKVGSATCQDGRATASSPLASAGIMHGSPLSDNSSQHSDSGILSSNGVVDYSTSKPQETAIYSRCVLALYSLAKDPCPQIAKLGQRTLSIIGIEQVITKPLKLSGSSLRPGDTSPAPSLAGLARSSSWFDMNAGPLPLSFRTPPVSPPRQNFLTGMRRVCSLEFRPHQLNSPDSGLADPVLGSCISSISAERSLLPQSTIYRWSSGHFSRPLLTAAEDSEEILARREDRERLAMDHISKCQHTSVRKVSSQYASWDTKFEMGTKSMLMLPFSPFIVAADQSERIGIWNFEESTPINSFKNHDFPDKGVSNLCLLNELDDSLLLVASSNGNIRVWKDFTLSGGQKLVTAFSSIQGPHSNIRSSNVVVDWQQQSGYLFASNETSIMLWDLDKEQHVNSIFSSSGSSISALSASHVHSGQVVVGCEDGSIRLYDIRTPSVPVCTAKPHVQRVERVVGIGFQPGLDPAKIVSASQAGDIQFLDTRKSINPYLTIEAHRGSLMALAVHRHAPVIASGSAKQLIKVFSLDGDQIGAIRYCPITFMGQRVGSINCLTFHPYRVLLAAGASDSNVSIHAEENTLSR